MYASSPKGENTKLLTLRNSVKREWRNQHAKKRVANGGKAAAQGLQQPVAVAQEKRQEEMTAENRRPATPDYYLGTAGRHFDTSRKPSGYRIGRYLSGFLAGAAHEKWTGAGQHRMSRNPTNPHDPGKLGSVAFRLLASFRGETGEPEPQRWRA
jgi:hypothetical protein